MNLKSKKVVIVGAGMAGLTCAHYLERAAIEFVVYEGSEKVGGRVATVEKEGFLLDRGFQVLLTSYPEPWKLLKEEELALKPFFSGAQMWVDDHWKPLMHPFKHPSSLFELRKLPKGMLKDLWKLAYLYLTSSPQGTGSTWDLIQSAKISDVLVESFLRPFFGGVFLEKDLQTSQSEFLRLLGFFGKGEATLPAGGMGALPHQLAASLKKGKVETGVRVQAVDEGGVVLSNGDRVEADRVVIATDNPSLRALLPGIETPPSVGVTNLYFSVAEDRLAPDPILYLNGSGRGVINNISFNSRVQGSYAPKGLHLCSVTVLEGNPSGDLARKVQEELEELFHVPAQHWAHLESFFIEHALPQQISPPPLHECPQIAELPHTYFCGEVAGRASINGAMASGREVAERIGMQ